MDEKLDTVKSMLKDDRAVEGSSGTTGTSVVNGDVVESTIDLDLIRDREAAVAELVHQLSEIISMDGGKLRLVEVDVVRGIVSVELQGACVSCAISSSTLAGGVERILKERLSWVTEVIGAVDEEFDFEESVAMGRGRYVEREFE